MGVRKQGGSNRKKTPVKDMAPKAEQVKGGSSVSKTRSEISLTFARNARG